LWRWLSAGLSDVVGNTSGLGLSSVAWVFPVIHDSAIHALKKYFTPFSANTRHAGDGVWQDSWRVVFVAELLSENSFGP
jgi:hypothetical protein